MEEIQPILARFAELEKLLAEHAARAQSPEYTAWLKEHARLSKTVNRWRSLESLQRQIADAQSLLADPEMRPTAEEELARLTPKEAAARTELEAILLESGEPVVSSLIVEKGYLLDSTCHDILWRHGHGRKRTHALHSARLTASMHKSLPSRAPQRVVCS